VKNQKTAAKTHVRLKPPKEEKNCAPHKSADLAEAGYGFPLECSNSVRHLYLISGEVYRVGKSDLTRIR